MIQRKGTGGGEQGQRRKQKIELDPRFTDNYAIDEVCREHGQDIRFVQEEGRWLTWDGARWQRDRVRLIESLVRQTLERIASTLERDAARVEGDKRPFMGRATFLRSHRAVARILEGVAGTGTISPVVRVCVPAVAIDSDEVTGHLLNCTNGLLDLRSLRLVPHAESRVCMVTKLCETAYRPEAQCPEFIAALERIFLADRDPDRAREIIDALQLALGYSLCGDQGWHAIFVLHGTQGNNGKSLVLKIVQSVLGPDYATSLHRSVLVQGRGEQHPTGLLELRGRRVVVATEFAKKQEFDGALLKQLSGDDRLAGRRMHQDFVQFKPTHHLWIASNELPRMDQNDAPLWSRFVVFPFERRFVRVDEPHYHETLPAHREDPTLAKRILAHEREGVLAWMVEGLRRYQRDGSKRIPQELLLAHARLGGEVDPVGAWIAECCDLEQKGEGEPGQRFVTPAKVLYEHFTAWCLQAGRPALTQTALGRAMTARGVAESRSGGDRVRTGIQLRGGRS